MEQRLHTFTVIIPARDEATRLGDCLRSLQAQDYEGAFDVIVIDNASTDETAAVAERAGVRVVHHAPPGVSGARRRGCAEACGEIIAMTDADSLVPRDWLRRLNDWFVARERIVAAGGLYRFDDASPFMDFFANRLVLSLNTWALASCPRLFPSILAGTNMAVRRVAYEASGGFDARLEYGEDLELLKRLARLGEIQFDPSLIVGTSFRRYSGGHESTLVVAPNAIGALAVAVWRWMLGGLFGKTFAAQPAIRARRVTHGSARRQRRPRSAPVSQSR